MCYEGLVIHLGGERGTLSRAKGTAAEHSRATRGSLPSIVVDYVQIEVESCAISLIGTPSKNGVTSANIIFHSVKRPASFAIPVNCPFMRRTTVNRRTDGLHSASTVQEFCV